MEIEKMEILELKTEKESLGIEDSSYMTLVVTHNQLTKELKVKLSDTIQSVVVLVKNAMSVIGPLYLSCFLSTLRGVPYIENTLRSPSLKNKQILENVSTKNFTSNYLVS